MLLFLIIKFFYAIIVFPLSANLKIKSFVFILLIIKRTILCSKLVLWDLAHSVLIISTVLYFKELEQVFLIIFSSIPNKSRILTERWGCILCLKPLSINWFSSLVKPVFQMFMNVSKNWWLENVEWIIYLGIWLNFFFVSSCYIKYFW